MNPDIEAIFLDVGNTLRIVLPEADFIARARQDLMDLVNPQVSETEFFDILEKRWKVYRTASKASLLEASEKELWTQHLLPDYPYEKIAPISGRLTRLWRDHDGRRVPRPDVSDVVKELSRRGYVLGIIANTITETEIPDWMESDGLTEYLRRWCFPPRCAFANPTPRSTGKPRAGWGWSRPNALMSATTRCVMWKVQPEGCNTVLLLHFDAVYQDL